MNFIEMEQAIREARQTMNAADHQAEVMVGLLLGRLRQAGTSYSAAYALSRLKLELRDFNAHTKRWRS